MSRLMLLLSTTALAAALAAPASALAQEAGPRLMENVRKSQAASMGMRSRWM